MARGKILPPEEKLVKVREDIAKAKARMEKLEAKEKELEAKIDEKKVGEVADIMKKEGLTIEELKKIIGEAKNKEK